MHCLVTLKEGICKIKSSSDKIFLSAKHKTFMKYRPYKILLNKITRPYEKASKKSLPTKIIKEAKQIAKKKKI